MIKNKNMDLKEHTRFNEIAQTAIILAGGKSSRMGFDKQFLEINNRRILDVLCDKLKEEFREIIIVTNKPEFYKGMSYRVVCDEIKESGPLGGIHIGLKTSSSKFSYFIACDMPNINLNYIRAMKKNIIELNKDACITKRKNGNIEPFNAFYSKSIIEHIEKQLLDNKRAIKYLIDTINAVYIDEEYAEKFNSTLDMFVNLNTKEDVSSYAKAHERIRLVYKWRK